MIFTCHYDQTNRRISNPRVLNERYGYHITTETFWFIVGQVVWPQGVVKVEYFFQGFFLSKITYFGPNVFEFFSKLMKPNVNGHKYRVIQVLSAGPLNAALKREMSE